jgi:Cu-Zn family superoxide dismutase
MATKLSALGAPIALLALVLVLMANGGSSAAPSTDVGSGGTGEASGAGGDEADAIARLKDVDGNRVGVVRFMRDEGVVEVKARVSNVKPAGEFHGFHVHASGECDPNAVDPATGAVVPFFSAGGHLDLNPDPDDPDHGQHAGDFPVLLVQSDGHAEARFDTDRFRLRHLFDDDGSAVIVHAGRDNYANIPATTPTGADRYHSHSEGVFGPDSVTKATGDAGARFACGVVNRP